MARPPLLQLIDVVVVGGGCGGGGGVMVVVVWGGCVCVCGGAGVRACNLSLTRFDLL